MQINLPLAPDRVQRERNEHEMRKAYGQVFEDCLGLVISKSLDYGDPDPAKTSYMPFGDASYATMLHTKTQRLVHLVQKAQKGEAPNHEGLDDTIRDLINYAFFFAVARGIGKGETTP